MKLIDADRLKQNLKFEKNITHTKLVELIDRQPLIDQDKIVAQVNNGHLSKWQGRNVIVYNIPWLSTRTEEEFEKLFGKEEGEADEYADNE